MVGATVCIAFVSMSVWAHHMFTIGMNSYANSFFTITTMAVGVPTGIKIFNWLGTMWGGKIQFKTPMLFCIGFLFQFLIAGLTGIMLASSPFDWQLSGSYFVVAHFHYVIVGGILFALFGAFYYWYPKITGRMLNEGLGKLHFWLFLIGFHLTFDLMHIPGLLGMPRRIYTYEPGRGWETLNLLVTIGAFVQGIATLVFVANLVISYFKGAKAGNDPWDAWTLEWSTSSPPPAYNFASIPTVASRRPLWDLKHPEDPGVRHLYHFRCGLSVLRGEELLRADSPRSAGDAHLLHDLSALQQSDCPLCGKASRTRQARNISHFMVAHDRSRCPLSVRHCPGMAPVNLRARTDHLHEPFWNNVLLACWSARVSRHRWTDHAEHRAVVRAGRSR